MGRQTLEARRPLGRQALGLAQGRVGGTRKIVRPGTSQGKHQQEGAGQGEEAGLHNRLLLKVLQG